MIWPFSILMILVGLFAYRRLCRAADRLIVAVDPDIL